jgi:HD superfamily phosphohydrolase
MARSKKADIPAPSSQSDGLFPGKEDAVGNEMEHGKGSGNGILDPIAEMADVIVKGWENGRIPLFLFGAGGSPFKINQYKIAQDAIATYEKKSERKYTGTPIPKSAIEKGCSRPVQARIFSDLKNYEDPQTRKKEAWGTFGKLFLEKWIVEFSPYCPPDAGLAAVQKKEETNTLEKYYGFLSTCLENGKSFFNLSPGALVLTTNFDGAIVQYLSESKDKKATPCLVLDTPAQIRATGRLNVGSRTKNKGQKRDAAAPNKTENDSTSLVKYIVALRGDVYHLICHNPLCSVNHTKVSIYDALQNVSGKIDKISIYDALQNMPDKIDKVSIYDALRNVSGKIDVKTLLKCPECGEEREMTISFPGLEIKEQEICETMNAVWEAFGSRISMICTVGFSGNSDREVVNSLLRIAEHVGCSWYDINKNGASDQAKDDKATISPIARLKRALENKTALRETVSNYLCPSSTKEGAVPNRLSSSSSKPLFVPIDEDGENVTHLPKLKSKLEKGVNSFQTQSTDSGQNIGRELEPDFMWVRKAREDDNNATLRAKFPVELKNLQDGLKNCQNHIAIDEVSQLAMKTFWWRNSEEDGNKVSPLLHTRFSHSLGVLRVADAWFSRLTPEDVASKIGSCYGKWKVLLRKAALLHDMGHIPFSHLIEEVFCELHWSFNGNDEYTHEELTRARLPHLLDSQSDLVKDEDIAEINRLIDGRTGIHWLDSIMNSPFDADKIDYIFRDQHWIGLRGRTGHHASWFIDFLNNQKISPHGQIFLHGKSAEAAYKLLSERAYLYDTLYFSPRLRLMERIVRYILVTYFVLKISSELCGRLCEAIKGTSQISPLSFDLFDKIVVSSDDKKEEKQQKKGTSIPREMNKSFLDMFKKYWSRTHVDQIGCMVDMGQVKLACSIGSLYHMMEENFPESGRIRHANSKQQMSLSKETADDQIEKFKKFLKGMGDNDFRNMPNEGKIIAEIGCWACSREEQERSQGIVASSEQYLEFLIGMCHLVLDPNYGNDGGAPYEASEIANGKWLDRVFEEHCIAGPYVVHAPSVEVPIHEAEDRLKEQKQILEEIGRQLAYEYPGRALLDITGPLKVRSYPSSRVMHGAKGQPLVCEQFWVPSGDPQSWSSRSEATIPLSSVDFRSSIPQAYKLRVILIDPSLGKDGRHVVADRFCLACRRHGIALEQEITYDE